VIICFPWVATTEPYTEVTLQSPLKPDEKAADAAVKASIAPANLRKGDY
jgi:hypothetical protein